MPSRMICGACWKESTNSKKNLCEKCKQKLKNDSKKLWKELLNKRK